MRKAIFILTISVSSVLLSQQEEVLIQQKTAIKRLAERAGMSDAQLNQFLIDDYGVGIDGLSRGEAKSIIEK